MSSHLCCTVLVCSVSPDTTSFMSPLTRWYSPNQGESERKSGVYYMHLRSHLQHKQLKTELDKELRSVVEKVEQMLSVNHVVGSAIVTHVAHVAWELVLSNCVIVTLVFSRSGDIIKANIDASVQTRTHEVCVSAVVDVDKVVLSLNGGDVLTVVNSMRDKAKRLFLPSKSKAGLARFFRFSGDRGKYVDFNALGTMLCIGDLHSIQLYKFIHDVVRQTQISEANRDDQNVNRLSLGQDTGLAVYEVATVQVESRAILFSQFSKHRHMPNTLLMVSQEENPKSDKFGQLCVQYWKYNMDSQTTDVGATLWIAAGVSAEEKVALDWSQGPVCNPDAVARNREESRIVVCFRDGSIVLVATNPFLVERGSKADRTRPQTNAFPSSSTDVKTPSLQSSQEFKEIARVKLRSHLGTPYHALWHPSDGFLLVFCTSGEVVAFDTALQPLMFLDQTGGLSPAPLRLTSVLSFENTDLPPRVTSAVWGCHEEPERGCTCANTNPVCEEASFGQNHLAIAMDNGPLLVMHFKTGFRGGLDSLALLCHRLARNEMYCCIDMLYQMDRDYDIALTMVCNALFRMDTTDTVRPCAARLNNAVVEPRGEGKRTVHKRPLQLVQDALDAFWRRYDVLHAESQQRRTLAQSSKSSQANNEDAKFVDLFEVLHVLYTRLFYSLLHCDFVDDAFTVAKRLKRPALYHDLLTASKVAGLDHVAELCVQALEKLQ